MAKQKVRILSDGTIDLSPQWVKELNIGILSTQIMIEDREKPWDLIVWELDGLGITAVIGSNRQQYVT